MLSSRDHVLNVHPRQFAIAGAAAVLVAYLAAFAAIYDAHRDERAANGAELDARQLLEAPAPSLNSLRSRADDAKAALAEAQAGVSRSSIDPSSDAAITLLVRRAQDAGLSVLGIARLDASKAEVRDVTYAVNGVRITVEGDGPASITGFLTSLRESDPGLVPALTGMTVDDASAQAELVFSVYTPEEVAADAAPAAPR